MKIRGIYLTNEDRRRVLKAYNKSFWNKFVSNNWLAVTYFEIDSSGRLTDPKLNQLNKEN